MYRLGLIHETMLVTTAPGPTLVLDQSLAGPARAGRLATSDRRRRWQGILETLNMVEWAMTGIAILVPVDLTPVTDPALTGIQFHDGFALFFAGATAWRPARVDG